MQTKLGFACSVGWLSLIVGTAAVACGDDEGKTGGAANAAGESTSGGNGEASSQGGAPDSTSEGGSGPSPSGGRGGTKNEPTDPDDPLQPGAAGGGTDSPDFDGVDLTEIPTGTAPVGCVGGFEPELGALLLEASGEASLVHVNVVDGVVHANGVACESADGAPANAAELVTLELIGGAGDQHVVLDLSAGGFDACYSTAGGIKVDLGEGDDTFTLLGTLDADVIRAGSEGGALALDVTDDERVDLVVEASPKVVISTGAKDDLVRADGSGLALEPAELPLWIYGGGAGDELVGGAAADHLFGGIGNDWFDAGSAASGGDIFDGGDGNDTVDFSARSAALTITMGMGADDGEADEMADIADSVEDLLGGQGVNEITGGPASNHIWGGPEADALSGGAGDDTLIGNAGNDVLSGDSGNDTLYGEQGDDQVSGGADDDLLDGGEGKDGVDGGAGDGDICIQVGTDTVKACEL